MRCRCDTLTGMKRAITVFVAAVLGSLAGSIVRQSVMRRREAEQAELVVAVHPAALLAGVAAGLLLPRFRSAAAFVVAANVGANMPTGTEPTARPTDADPE